MEEKKKSSWGKIFTFTVLDIYSGKKRNLYITEVCF